MRRVLVVEDDRELLGELREVLEEDGYRVDTVGNGAEALARLSAGLRPDAILLDLLMPIMDGWELLCRLEERDDLRELPVLVMSAAARMPPPRLGLCYIPKPLCIETVLSHVGALIDRHPVSAPANGTPPAPGDVGPATGASGAPAAE